MAQGSLKVVLALLIVCISLCTFNEAAGNAPLKAIAINDFNVRNYGVRADGQTDDSNVF